jgi:protein-disulfide isomerase
MIAVVLFAALIGLRYLPVGRSAVSVAVAVGLWVAMFESGVDPVISGLAVGLITSAYPPPRGDLERATALTRSFREQPTPEMARSAQQGLLSAISANDRLQFQLHPWVSYVVLPLFALSNAGLHLTGTLLEAAIRSPITLGIAIAYVLGKPVGIYAGSWVASRPSLHGPRPLVSGPVLAAGGACAGIGFTVSLLISSLAFRGEQLSEAKLGALCTLVLAPMVSWAGIRLIRRIPAARRARQISRTALDIPDLAEDVDPERDHIRGPADAPVTLLEYGDFECPYCGRAEETIRELLVSAGSDVRYVWRHLPLNDVHPRAQLAAEATEAAADQGRFWEMHDALLADQDALRVSDLERVAAEIGLDVERFTDDLHSHRQAGRVLADVVSADESGVSGTPTFFVNGRRHYGVYDIDALTAAVSAAKRRLVPGAPV